MSGVVFASVTPMDATGIVALLERSSLPTDGLVEHLAEAVVARRDRGGC